MSISVQEFQADMDTLEYLQELRTALLDAYSQITLGVQESNAMPVMQPFLQGIILFLGETCKIDQNIVSKPNSLSNHCSLA